MTTAIESEGQQQLVTVSYKHKVVELAMELFGTLCECNFMKFFCLDSGMVIILDGGGERG